MTDTTATPADMIKVTIVLRYDADGNFDVCSAGDIEDGVYQFESFEGDQARNRTVTINMLLPPIRNEEVLVTLPAAPEVEVMVVATAA
jgi:hypothetical protein